MATSVTTGAPTLDDTAVQGLAAAMRGPLIQPGDPSYDEARTVYNAMIDKRPALIAQCADVADVIAAVNFARENGLLVAIRGGGHNGPGLGTCRRRAGHRPLADERRPRRSGGPHRARRGRRARWATSHHATHAFGLATPSGIISTTGVGGITLGGGLGHLTRQFGLAIDNLLEADVVLADGSFVTASETENPDLFWALRGGGGNFGVVTSFLFRLHPIRHRLRRADALAAGALGRGAALVPRLHHPAPRTSSTASSPSSPCPPVAPFPEELWDQKMCGVVWCYTGDDAGGDVRPDPRPVRAAGARLGRPDLRTRRCNSMFDGLYPPGDQWYWKADFVKEIPDEAIEHPRRVRRAAADLEVDDAPLPDRRRGRPGAPRTRPPGTTGTPSGAWSSSGSAPTRPTTRQMIAWTRAYWEALHPYSAGGAYVNMMMDADDEGQDRVRAAYGDHYDRLARIKGKYDPDNLFRVNQNITPA